MKWPHGSALSGIALVLAMVGLASMLGRDDPGAVPATRVIGAGPGLPDGTRVAVDLGYGPIWVRTRPDAAVDPDPTDEDPDRPPEQGKVAALVDPDGDRVTLFADRGLFRLACLPDSPAREQAIRRAAGEGRILAVPRGALALVVDADHDEVTPGVRPVEVRLGPPGDATWLVKEDFVR